MSEDTRNWRPLLSSAANKLQSFKGYLATKDPRPLSPASPSSSFQRGDGDPASCGADSGSGTRQSWTQWAGDKLRRSGQPEGNNVNVVEKVSLFPGWAARRLHNPSPGEGAWSLRVIHAVSLNICRRHPLRYRGLCCWVRRETQQSRVYVAVTESIPEARKRCAPLLQHIFWCSSTLL